MAEPIYKGRVLIRRPRVQGRTGKCRSTIYEEIADGTFPPPVRIGARAVAWPEDEIDAINAARIAGKSKEEIRRLVIELVAARKSLAQGPSQ